MGPMMPKKLVHHEQNMDALTKCLVETEKMETHHNNTIIQIVSNFSSFFFDIWKKC